MNGSTTRGSRRRDFSVWRCSDCDESATVDANGTKIRTATIGPHGCKMEQTETMETDGRNSFQLLFIKILKTLLVETRKVLELAYNDE